MDVDGDFLGEVAVGDGDGYVGDVSDLGRQIAGHDVDAVGQVFPGAGDAMDQALRAQLAFGADFAGDAGDFGGERVQLVDHRVHGFFELQDFAADIDGDLLREIAISNSNDDVGDVANLGRQVTGHGVDAVGQVLPGAGDPGHGGLAAELAFGADFPGDARHFGGERTQLIHQRVDRFFELQDFAAHVGGDLLRQVAIGHGDRNVGDVSHLGGQIAGHNIDALGEILPNAAHVAHLCLPTELAFGADFPGNARHFGGEAPQLIDHGVDRIFELQGSAVGVDGDFFREVAVGDGDSDIGDVADLRS